MTAAFVEVAERIQVEPPPRPQDHRLAEIYEHAGVGIVEIDVDGTLLRVNAELCTLMGCQPEDLLGRSIFDASLSVDVEADRQQFRRQVAGELDRYSIEKRIRRKDGGYFWASITSSSIRDAEGRFLYAVRVQHDITDRKRYEETLARRMEEQSALYEFTERLQNTRILDELYEPALNAIMKALRCTRASILLFDSCGTMRFVAWHGLSDAYRSAVDGHSPWSRDTRNPQPIYINDVDRSDLPDALKGLVRGEGIAALAFIPLQEGDRLVGKFMAYYDAPHAFTVGEISLGLTIARQLGLSLERIQAETARSRVQEALQESEIRKSAILESALDGIITMDDQGRIIDFNPAAERLLRYRREDVLEKPAADIMIPERLRDAHSRGLRAYLDSGQGSVVGRRIEVSALRGDGSEFDAEVSVSASRLQNGRVVFTGYLRDISERKQAERVALQLASIVESSDDAIVSKNLDGIIMTWNRGAERIFGYAAEEAIGKPITIIIPPDRQEEEPEILMRIRRGERIDHYETVRRRKDGRLIDISLTVSPMKDAKGRIIGASKIARDITQRKEDEAKLRESERRLQELLAAVPAAIYTTDAQGRITYFNEAAVELAGRRPTLGTDEWCVTWKLYWPDGTPLPHDQCPMAVALKEGRPIRNAEAIAERPDGTRVPFIPYPTPLRDANGNIVGAINMLVDISERRQAETHQRVLLKELNHRVKNNMQMLQSLLSYAAAQTKSEEARNVLADASGRITAMAAAQRVLYGTTDTMRFNAREFVGSVCETVRQTLPVKFKIVYEAASVDLPNDSAMPLALILNELLTNAAKHGLNGAEEGTIRVGLTREDGTFRLSVEDEGPGFDLESVQGGLSGLRLVEGFARQLRGRFDVTKHGTTCCSVRFG
jgi:PAS domain S-box-containing protein